MSTPLVDVFMYFNEPELLELRYYMYKDKVEKFVVSECNYTFSGISKPYTLKKTIKDLGLDEDKFIILEVDVSDDKIVYHKFDTEYSNLVQKPDHKIAYARQRLQRDAILNIIDTFSDNTIFVCSDIDEIIDVKSIDYLVSVISKYPKNILKVPLVSLEGTADSRLYAQDGSIVPWQRSAFLAGKQAIKEVGVNALRAEFDNIYSPISVTENGAVLQDLGWHFSWMGSKNYKLLKAKSCLHSLVPHLINNISNRTKAELRNELGDDIGAVTSYHIKPYDLDKLPTQIFSLPRVKSFLLPNLKPPKIVDYVMYFNEKELLELRYHMLKDVVDLFVISESNTTFSGKNKEFSVEKVIQDLNLDTKKFRIIKSDHTLIDDKCIMPIDEVYSIIANDQKHVLSWVRERLQRDALTSILEEFTDDCMFIVSDIDEIVKPDAIEYLTRVALENQNYIIKVPLVLLEGRADKRIVDENNQIVNWDKSLFLASKKQLKAQTPNSIRGNSQNQFTVTYITENCKRVEDLGWHFTWMGNTGRKKIKAQSYGHAGNLSAANTLSNESYKVIANMVNDKNPSKFKFNTIDYSIDKLPKQIFESKTVQNFLLPNEFRQEKLLAFIKDPQNYKTNFELGLEYEKVGQTASAVSYYLRAAEKTTDLRIQFESILRIAFCFQHQKNRNFSVSGLLVRTVTIDPTRPEGYYHLAKHYFDVREFQLAYLYATLGLTIPNKNIEQLTDLKFKGLYDLEYLKGISGWYVGFYSQSKEILRSLQARNDVDIDTKRKIYHDLQKVVK